eukprot:CCRYP_011869-RA/>CCRYP_011869-RA protein AED:0.29 eAED:0.29 QI:119/1/1/1/0/0/2/288/193
MPPTITNCDDTEPSAPPLREAEIPVVSAYAVSSDAVPAVATVPPKAASLPPRQPPYAAVPQGMVSKSVTTTYSDGRQVTVTEYQPADTSNGAAANANSTSATPSTSTPQVIFAPRRDLGSNPVALTCPFCSHAGITRTTLACGDCTWISVIILLLVCCPLFWVPFVCSNCMDTKHHCRNCGRQVGESRAECCS